MWIIVRYLDSAAKHLFDPRKEGLRHVQRDNFNTVALGLRTTLEPGDDLLSPSALEGRSRSFTKMMLRFYRLPYNIRRNLKNGSMDIFTELLSMLTPMNHRHGITHTEISWEKIQNVPAV